jgi:GT2 family glycosyltransferase
MTLFSSSQICQSVPQCVVEHIGGLDRIADQMETPAQMSAVVLAFGPEVHLNACVAAILASCDLDGAPLELELIVIDNGSAAVADLAADRRLRVIQPGRNLGFAGGCNLGAQAAVGRDLILVNSDAIVEPNAIQALVTALAPSNVGIVSGSVRLADTPELMNTAGNPVHFLGLAWAGSFGESSELHQQPTDITSASGALCAITRDTWQRLGGFDERYFAYHEDVDLSLRCWQLGLRVRFEPRAVAHHFYAFSRNPTKQYLLERNRWITVFTVFPGPALAAALVIAPFFELLMCALAGSQGWLPDKLRGYRWLIRNRRYLRERRQQVQGVSTISTPDFLRLLSSRIEPAEMIQPPGLSALNLVLASYWRLVGLITRSRPTTSPPAR